MIVSHRHSFVFVAIPKTGTHSIREALRPHLHADDWEQCRLFVKKAFPLPQVAAVKHGHISCRQIRQHLHPAMWETYLKFCVVRNPFARFVSYCHFFHRECQKMSRDPLGTMKQAITCPEAPRRLLVRPQCDFISDTDGKLLIDRICNIETLRHDFAAVLNELGLPPVAPEHRNTSAHGRYQDYYDDELRELVGQFYQRDLTMLGYTFDEPVEQAQQTLVTDS